MSLRIYLVVATKAEWQRLNRLLPNTAYRAGWGTADDCRAAASNQPIDLVLGTAEALPEADPALHDFLRLPGLPDVIVCCRREDARERARLLANGVAGVLHWGLPDEVLANSLSGMCERVAARQMFRRVAEAGLQSSDSTTVSSPPMKALLRTARRAARADTSVLILGETGVGKERLAKFIHRESKRADRPFIAVNCAAIPDALLESELFGHEKGAFTGALRSHRGVFELAHGGTLLLDEVGELPLASQPKLLRVLQDGQVQPVGGESPIHVDVRIIAATNRDLRSRVASGEFRSDLYYRIGVVTLELPPLRERREDLPLLIDQYREIFSARLARPNVRFTTAARDALVACDWPGNVRELMNVIENAVLLCEDDIIDVCDLPHTVAGQNRQPQPGRELAAQEQPFVLATSRWRQRSWDDVRTEVLLAAERHYFALQLESARGIVKEVALRSAINVRSVLRHLRHAGLRKEDYRPVNRR